jgi:LuxR family transcriptional regulator, maltose regulon positive regulatory protein
MLPVPAGCTMVPQLPDPFVPRARLLTALDNEGSDLTLVCAPAGFGKSALLAHWARAAAKTTPVAWANLSSATGSLWDAVLPAVLSCPEVPGDSLLHELARRGEASTTTAFTADVLAALDVLPKQVALILHDIHEIVAPTARAALEALVATRPAGVRLILCSRWDTPSLLWDMRSAGRLTEIRANRLCFSADETRALLRLSKLDLEVEQARELHARVEGWPIGTRLACVALRGGADPAPFLQRFAHVVQPAADFLVGEVLTGLRPADRDLLAVIGAAGSVTAAAGTDPSGRTDSDQALDRLIRESGLVVRGPRAQVRVHPLVAPYLRGEHRAGRGRSAQREGSASSLRVAQDDPLGAIRHAVLTDDADLIVELVHRFAGLLLVTGGHPVLGWALSRVDGRVVAEDSVLLLCARLADIEAGLVKVPAAETDSSVRSPRGGPGQATATARSAILRSITGVFAAASTGDPGVAPTAVDVARSRRDSPEWTALALVGAGGRAMLVNGDMASATAAFDEALELAEVNGFAYLRMQCLALLACAAGIDGDYSTMASAAAGADDAATSGGWELSPLASAARWMLAYSALLRSEPLEAYRLARETLRSGGSTLRARSVFALRALQGAAMFDCGQRHRGLQEMQRARAELGEVRLGHEQASVLAVLEHRAALTLGRTHAAHDVVVWLAERIGIRAEILLMRAWAEQSAGRVRAAKVLVEPILDGTGTPVLPHTIVEALLLEVSAGVRDGDVETARRALHDALSVGASLGTVRPFAMAPEQARELLAEHLGRVGATDPFAIKALAVVHRPDARAARLDRIERALLVRLPSALSVDQIARELRIPPTEASTRIRAIYRKLGVSSRRTAVSAADEEGLLH